jgi:tetratricopeptide (TPR) repeat protein
MAFGRFLFAAVAALAAAFAAEAAAQSAPGSIEGLRQQVAQNPGDAELRVALGNALDDAGDSAGAVAQYREAIRVNPKYAPAYRNLALAHMRLEQWAAAESAARDALRLNEKYTLAQCDLSVILGRSGNSEGAVRSWQQALKMDARGVARYSRLDRIPVALEEFLRAQTPAAAQMLFALTLRDAGDRSRAADELLRAGQLDTQIGLPYFLAREIYLADSNARAAAAMETETLRRNPGYRDALGRAAPGVAPGTPAEDGYSPYRQMVPNLILARRIKSATPEQTARATELLKESARRLQAMLAAEPPPGTPDAHLLLGDALRELGEPAAARAYRKAIAAAGDAQPAAAARGWLGLGRLEEAAGRERTALDYYALGLRAWPGEPELLAASALIYAAGKDETLRDARMALNWAQLAVERSRGKTPEPLRALAEAQFASGQPAEAVRTMKRVLELVPDDHSLRERILAMDQAARARR